MNISNGVQTHSRVSWRGVCSFIFVVGVSTWLVGQCLAKDPLDKLRRRSAERDWKKLQERYTDTDVASPGMSGNPQNGVSQMPTSQSGVGAQQDFQNRSEESLSQTQLPPEPVTASRMKPQGMQQVQTQPQKVISEGSLSRSAQLSGELESVSPDAQMQKRLQRSEENLSSIPLTPYEFEVFKASEVRPLFEDYLPTQTGIADEGMVSEKAQPAPSDQTFDELPVGLFGIDESIVEHSNVEHSKLPPLPETSMDRIRQERRSAGEITAYPVSTTVQPDRLFLLPEFRDPETDPAQLAKITNISPFLTYEPDPETRRTDPLRNICLDDCPECDERVDYMCPEVFYKESGTLDRYFGDTNFQWTATNVHHNPLYFEDVTLERYGHDHHPLVQPVISVGKFSGQLLGLPYQMVLHPVHEDVYPLGYYRPGEPTPRLLYQIPLNAEAAAVTGAVYTGLFFLLP